MLTLGFSSGRKSIGVTCHPHHVTARMRPVAAGVALIARPSWHVSGPTENEAFLHVHTALPGVGLVLPTGGWRGSVR